MRFEVDQNEEGRWRVRLREFNLCCDDVGEADRLCADLNAAIGDGLYTAEEVRAAVLAEREACAEVVEQRSLYPAWALEVGDLIRSRPAPEVKP